MHRRGRSGVPPTLRRTRVWRRDIAVWHSLICLACTPFVPRSLLRCLHRVRPLLRLFPRIMVLLGEIANTRHMTGELPFLPAVKRVYPGLARYFERHPRLRRVAGSAARRLSRS